jgi:hypothetical protein
MQHMQKRLCGTVRKTDNHTLQRTPPLHKIQQSHFCICYAHTQQQPRFWPKRRNFKTIKTMHKRHENELLGGSIHTYTSQTQHIDFREAGHWHQSTLWLGLHTTWPTTHPLTHFLSPLWTARQHNRVSPILRFNLLIFFNLKLKYSSILAKLA